MAAWLSSPSAVLLLALPNFRKAAAAVLARAGFHPSLSQLASLLRCPVVHRQKQACQHHVFLKNFDGLMDRHTSCSHPTSSLDYLSRRVT